MNTFKTLLGWETRTPTAAQQQNQSAAESQASPNTILTTPRLTDTTFFSCQTLYPDVATVQQNRHAGCLHTSADDNQLAEM